MKTIDQFMWSYQHIFRRDLESAASNSLREIGAIVAPTALLVGFQEVDGGHPVCVEPEASGIDPATFTSCLAAGDAAYEVHENRQMFMTDKRLHESFHAGLRDNCRSLAIRETLEAQVDPESRRWFVGPSTRVGRYRVYPVIGVLRGRWDELPSLTHRDHDHRIEMYLSLQEAVLRELLGNATFALSISDQPQGMRRHDRDDIVRRASHEFLGRLVLFRGDFMGADLFSSMNLVAAQPYEGRTGVGTLLMSNASDSTLELRFDQEISLKATRALRKALEMTDQDLHLVTNGSVAVGLGRLHTHHPAGQESSFYLRVIGRGSWELEHSETALMTVTDGRASIPRERLSRPAFDDAVERLFDDSADAERLWSLAVSASRQAHGTMLVVHAQAESEAARLSPPAMSIEPGQLTESALLAVSAIDGAIVVDPAGNCHAIGAILDGRAAPGLGDASRGARFNSAQRYLAETAHDCLIIIVSEDGMINLIPDLPRRVKKSYVEDVLSEVETLSRTHPVDLETFHKSETHLRSLAFYLTAKQCERANEARERVEQFREASFKLEGGLGGITRVGYSPFEPDSRLDASFFLPESPSP